MRAVFARGCVHEPVEQQGCPRRGGESVLRPPTAAPAEGVRVSAGRPVPVSTALCVCVCVCVCARARVRGGGRMGAPTCVCWGLWFRVSLPEPVSELPVVSACGCLLQGCGGV